jgi:hypothetical protein
MFAPGRRAGVAAGRDCTGWPTGRVSSNTEALRWTAAGRASPARVLEWTGIARGNPEIMGHAENQRHRTGGHPLSNEVIGGSAFARNGIVQVSMPVSMRRLDGSAFRGTPLAVLDPSASTSVKVEGCHGDRMEVTKLGLPRDGFAGLTSTLLPSSRVEGRYADIDVADLGQLLPRLGERAIGRLRAVSPRLEEPFEWPGSSPSGSVAVSEPATINAPSAVTLTKWRRFPRGVRCVLCGQMTSRHFAICLGTRHPRVRTSWNR